MLRLTEDQRVRMRDMEFSQVLLFWLHNVKKPMVEENTFNNYCISLVKYEIPFFKRKKINRAALSQLDIQSFYDFLETKNLKANTILKHHSYIHDCLQWAWKEDLIQENYSEKVFLKPKEQFVPNFLDINQIPACLELFKNDPLELAVWIGLFLGFRRSEVIGLKWSQVDFERKTITVKTVVVTSIDPITQKAKILIKSKPKTTCSERTLPIPDRLLELLRWTKYTQELNQKKYGDAYCTEYLGFVCVDERGYLLCPDYISRHFRSVWDKSDLPYLRFHDLRHSCGSMLHYLGYDLQDIKDWLGHKDIRTTSNIYLHTGIMRKKQIVGSINQMVSVNT